MNEKDFNNTNSFIDFPCDINFSRLSTGIYFYRVRIINDKGGEAMTLHKIMKGN